MLPWQTAPQLAALWSNSELGPIPVRTVRRWASEDRWPRTSTRPVRYDPDYAQDSFERRRAGRAETLANLALHRRRAATRR